MKSFFSCPDPVLQNTKEVTFTILQSLCWNTLKCRCFLMKDSVKGLHIFHHLEFRGSHTAVLCSS